LHAREEAIVKKDEPIPEGAEIINVIATQLEHFRRSNPPCRGVQLPDGILLRHTLSRSLYFYLRTRIEDGKINTCVYASDSPYDRQKATIGEVSTSIFVEGADDIQLEKLEKLLRDWVHFVREEPETIQEFQGFEFDKN
jgi:hypothetical protein